MHGYPNQWFQNTGGTSMRRSQPPNSTRQNKSKISDWRQNMRLFLPVKVHSDMPRSPRGLRGLWTPNPPPSLRQIPIFWDQGNRGAAGTDRSHLVRWLECCSGHHLQGEPLKLWLWIQWIKTPTKYRFRCQIECLSNCQNFASLMHTLTKGNMAEASYLKAVKAFQNKGLSN